MISSELHYQSARLPETCWGTIALSRRAPLVAATVLTLAACTGFDDSPAQIVHRDAREEVDTSEVELIVQDVDKRTFNDWSIEKLELPTTPSIGNIDQLRIFVDRLFVYDLSDMNIERYALNGDLEAVYGKGRGEGPGEFRNIYSIWAREGDGVWIVDSMNRTVSRFRFDGVFLDSFKPEFVPARIAALAPDSLVILAYMQPELFVLVNDQGEIVKRFSGMVGNTPAVPTVVFDGQLFPNPEGGFIWAPRFASYLYFYDSRAQLQRRIELIDRHGFPIDRLGSNPQRMSGAALEQPHRTLAVSISDTGIFVNTLVREEERSYGVLDRYDRSTGKYLDRYARHSTDGNFWFMRV